MTGGEPQRLGLDLGEPQHLSIGEVLEQLRDEFPDVTISKIRFLESQGLIDPERTPSGYRKFSDDDLDRLRWILLQQRDHFLPLRVIKDRLDSHEGSGNPPVDQSVPPAVAADTPVFDEDAIDSEEDDDEQDALGSLEADPGVTGDELSRADLLEASGLTDAQLDALEDHGLLEPEAGAGERALYGERALEIASLAAGFYARGVEARHLKMYKHFSEREAGLFGQALMPYLRQRNPSARVRLQEELEELARLGRRLRSVTLREALRDELTE